MDLKKLFVELSQNQSSSCSTTCRLSIKIKIHFAQKPSSYSDRECVEAVALVLDVGGAGPGRAEGLKVQAEKAHLWKGIFEHLIKKNTLLQISRDGFNILRTGTALGDRVAD